ncbi:MAG TPA: cysteine--tRNA ligase, partial [Acidimicrobiia bacterium]|nr:cysteine--tRNA ligase [Acidimicrobiia bacterium]
AVVPDELDELAGAIEAIGRDLDLDSGTPESVLASLLAVRDKARAERDFTRSDEIRDRLAAIGIMIEDSADGSRWIRR